MIRAFIASAIIVLSIGVAGIAHADLDSFLGSLNVQARADLPGFSVKLGTQFGIPVPQVEAIIKTVEAPADAFMCLQLSEMSHKEPEVVVETYQKSRGKGWGVIAQDLGIKPGSSEFHALKRGDFALTGKPAGGGGKSASKGKGKK